MSILSETYIFYADVYFIQNWIIKIAVLYLSLFCNRQHDTLFTVRGMIKIILASFLGTILEIIGLLFFDSYNVFIACVHLLEVPLMIWFVLGKNYKKMLQVIVTGYFFVLVINGVIETMWNWFGEKGSYVFCLLFACGLVIIGVFIWKNYTKMQKGVFSVELIHKEKSTKTYGFYDSGNRLMDPYTGKGVHIVSKNILQRIGIEEETPVWIPYQALGNEEGILEVYYVDEVIIEGEKQRKSWQKSPLGVTKDNLFEGKNYEIILNEEVF